MGLLRRRAITFGPCSSRSMMGASPAPPSPQQLLESEAREAHRARQALGLDHVAPVATLVGMRRLLLFDSDDPDRLIHGVLQPRGNNAKTLRLV